MIDKLKKALSKQVNQFPRILVDSLTRSAIIFLMSDDLNFSRPQFVHLTFCPLAQGNFVAHSPGEVQKLLVAVEIHFGRNAPITTKYMLS